jgi:hypothetical protein
MANLDLSKYGIKDVKEVLYNRLKNMKAVKSREKLKELIKNTHTPFENIE